MHTMNEIGTALFVVDEGDVDQPTHMHIMTTFPCSVYSLKSANIGAMESHA